MEIPVLIEPVAENGFRARAVEPFSMTAEAGTRDAALQKLRELIEARLADGAEIVPLQVPAPEHPLARFAGMFKDDPYFDDWQRAIAEYRRQVEEDPEIP
jgi:predicted RNase H-like HicB family nuclease